LKFCTFLRKVIKCLSIEPNKKKLFWNLLTVGHKFPIFFLLFIAYLGNFNKILLFKKVLKLCAPVQKPVHLKQVPRSQNLMDTSN